MMEQRIILKQGLTTTMLCFALFFLCFLGEGAIPRAEAYKNYTVGDSMGWFDQLAKPTVDYDKWVSGKSFSLGDFLVFNTDSNHTVIQTHNFTTYDTCDAQGDDDIQWSSIDPNSTVVRPITVAVPLLKEGVTYFFSGDYDGEQCMHGQKFQIKVTHGQGLPPSLRDTYPDMSTGPTPTNSAPGPANPDAGDDQSAPDTVVSTNFNHPKSIPQDSTSGDDDDGDESESSKKSNGASIGPIREKYLGSLISGVLLFSLWDLLI